MQYSDINLDLWLSLEIKATGPHSCPHCRSNANGNRRRKRKEWMNLETLILSISFGSNALCSLLVTLYPRWTTWPSMSPLPDSQCPLHGLDCHLWKRMIVKSVAYNMFIVCPLTWHTVVHTSIHTACTTCTPDRHCSRSGYKLKL